MKINPGKRTCLRCNNPFMSKGVGNRLCPGCAKIGKGYHANLPSEKPNGGGKND